MHATEYPDHLTELMAHYLMNMTQDRRFSLQAMISFFILCDLWVVVLDSYWGYQKGDSLYV